MVKDIYKSFQTEVTSLIIGDQFHPPPHLQWNLHSKENCIILPCTTLKSFIISWISQLKIFSDELKKWFEERSK